MRRLDTDKGPKWFAATVYGKSGAGKTTLAVTAPKPLICLSESQAELPVLQAAQRLGVAIPPTLLIEHLNDCRAVARALRGPKDQPFRVFQWVGAGEDAKRELVFELPVEEWPETVVLDSVTDMMRLVAEEIREQSPQKQGRDGLPVDSERYWNVLGDRCLALIHGFRDAPVNKLFLCAEDDRDVGEGDDKRRSIMPSMPMRKLPNLLSGAGNFTGYAYRREVREKDQEGRTQVRVTYGVMSSGPEYMLLKPCPPIRSVEVPDYGYWVRKVRGGLEPAPKQPAPSGESLQATAVDEAMADTQQTVASAAPAAEPLPPEAPAAAPAATKRKRGGK